MSKLVLDLNGKVQEVSRYNYKDDQVDLIAPYARELTQADWEEAQQRGHELVKLGSVHLAHYIVKLEERLDEIESRLCK